MAGRLTYTSGGIDSATHVEFERCLSAARAAERAPSPHLIDGRAYAAGPVFERLDPARIDVVASRAHAALPETTALAVAAAARARREWRRSPYREALERPEAVGRRAGQGALGAPP